MPASLKGKVLSISWLTTREAVAVTDEAIYLIEVTRDPEPELLVTAPRQVSGLTGENLIVNLELEPVYGFEGAVEVEVELENLSLREGTVNLRSMCPVNYTIQLPLRFEGSRQARISLHDSGRSAAEATLIVNATPPKKERDGGIGG